MTHDYKHLINYGRCRIMDINRSVVKTSIVQLFMNMKWIWTEASW